MHIISVTDFLSSCSIAKNAFFCPTECSPHSAPNSSGRIDHPCLVYIVNSLIHRHYVNSNPWSKINNVSFLEKRNKSYLQTQLLCDSEEKKLCYIILYQFCTYSVQLIIYCICNVCCA